MALIDEKSLLSLVGLDLLLSRLQFFLDFHRLLLVKQALHRQLDLLQLARCKLARLGTRFMVKRVEKFPDGVTLVWAKFLSSWLLGRTQ